MAADLAQLSNYDEPAVVAAIEERYHRNEIYTHASSMLIALNPYADLGLYAAAVRRQYTVVAGGEGGDAKRVAAPPPHIFGVAARAFRGMLSAHSQCICVTGESGCMRM